MIATDLLVALSPDLISQVPTLLMVLIASMMMAVSVRLRLRLPPGPWGVADGVLALTVMVWLSTVSLFLAQLWFPDVLAPDVLAPDALAPDVLAPNALAADALAADGAGLLSAIAGTAFGGLSAVAFAIARARRAGRLHDLFGQRSGLGGYFLALSLVLPFLVVSAGWVALLDALGQEVAPQIIMQEVLATASEPVAGLAIAYGVLVAPLVEELLFRSFLLLPLAARLGPRLAIAATGLAFGLMHLADPASVVPLVLFGAVLAWLRLRTGSLGPSILLHVVNNALAFGLALWA